MGNPSISRVKGPFAPARSINPGIERYEVLRDDEGNVTGCENVWKNDTSFGNSAQVGTESGIIWGWGADPEVENEDLFYLTATSWQTGEEVFRTYIGDGKNFDPITGQVHIHTDGTLYIGPIHRKSSMVPFYSDYKHLQIHVLSTTVKIYVLYGVHKSRN